MASKIIDSLIRVVNMTTDVAGRVLDLFDDVENLENTIEGKSGLTTDAKIALLNCFQGVAWSSQNSQELREALEDALYPASEVSSISASYTQSGSVYATDGLDSLKSDLIVTASYIDGHTRVVSEYTLSGTLEVGSSTITVSYAGTYDTFDVAVSNVASVVSIEATYTQGSNVYEDDVLNDLKEDLVVRATWDNDDVTTVDDADYTLSGSLLIGDSTITVSYEGQTTTFVVVVSVTLPSGYTQYDYLQTDGSQYFNSGLSETDLDGCSYEYKCRVTGYPAVSNYAGGHVLSTTHNYTPFPQGQYNSEDPSSPKNNIMAKRRSTEKSVQNAWTLNTDMVIEAYKSDNVRSVKKDGVELFTIASGSTALSSSTYYYFFAYGGNPSDSKYRFVGRMYYFKIFDSTSNLIHMYVPVTNDSNVAGFYDAVENDFYPSDSATAFTVGNV